MPWSAGGNRLSSCDELVLEHLIASCLEQHAAATYGELFWLASWPVGDLEGVFGGLIVL